MALHSKVGLGKSVDMFLRVNVAWDVKLEYFEAEAPAALT